MRRRLLILGVVLLGLEVRGEVKPRDGPGYEWLSLDLHIIAVLIYSIVLIVLLYRMLDHLPGVFAMRRPLGPVRSGYEYLWVPMVFSALLGFSWTSPLTPGANEVWRFLTVQYGPAGDPVLYLIALGEFILMMIVLKFRAAMIEANRRLALAGSV